MDNHKCRSCRSSAGSWCWTWASSRPATTSRAATTRAPTRCTRCRCGCAHRAASPSCWPTRPCPRSRGAPSRPRSSRRRRRPWTASPRPACCRPGRESAEYGSPHGGSWLGLLTARGLVTADGAEQADVILDCFGLMHAADQRQALAERAARVAPGGVLLLQYHSLGTIIRSGQWNALRHGHYAYYSTTALTAMLAAVGFSPRTAWRFDLYGGTVLLAAARDADGPGEADETVRVAARGRAQPGVRDPGVLRRPPADVLAQANALHDWLATERGRGPDGPRLRRRLPGGRAAVPRAGGPQACCPRWPTPRRASTACGCRARTSRSSARPS